MGDLTENFSRWEVRCPCNCGDNISMDLMARVQIARYSIGLPFKVTSGVRCQEYNDSLPDSEKDSEHIPVDGAPGEGLDFQVVGAPGAKGRNMILTVLMPLFRRIGIGPDFYHVGVRESKPQDVIWLY